MQQINLRSVPVGDYFSNYLNKGLFWFYRKFFKSKLSSQSPRIRDGWELTFEDEFDHVSWGNSDTYEKWIVGQGWDPYVEGNVFYVGPPEAVANSTVANSSVAKFTSKYNPAMIRDNNGTPYYVPYQSSVISTIMNFKQQHGRFECRCTIPHGKGTWPAFWMWGSTWPPEIDVFEMWGGKDGKNSAVQWFNLHYNMKPDGGHDCLPRFGIRVEEENENNWHHFAVEWTPDRISFFTDGYKIYQYSDKNILDKFFNVETAKMWIVLGSGVDPKAGIGYPNVDNKYYTEFLVDYVRAYKKLIKF